MNDRKLLAATIKSRKAWELITSNLEGLALGADTMTLLELVGNQYNRDPSSTTADIDLLKSEISRTVQNPKHVKLFSTALDTLPDVSAVNVAQEILDAKKHSIGQRLAIALQRNSTDITNLLASYQNLSLVGDVGEEEVVERFKVQDLIGKSFDEKFLIPLYPPTLNKFLGGGVRPGHHVLVFAPTEMGKTLVVINMVAGFVKHAIRTLYVGNEDPVEDLQMRYINRITGYPKNEVIAHPDEVQKLLEKRGYENVIFAPLAPGNFTTIERLVDRFEPKVVVLDQLHNLDVGREIGVEAREKAATAARNLAKSRRVVVVSVSQAADSASGKRILNRGDLYGSNVAIQGQVDLMIGIGATEEDESSNIRWLSFPKNKISGDHQAFQIEINPQLSMVVDE